MHLQVIPQPEPSPPPTPPTPSGADQALTVRTKGPPAPSERLDALASVCEDASDTTPQEARQQPSPVSQDSQDRSPSPVVPTGSQDWESRKSLIQDMYMQQNLTLAEVVRRMHEEHNFRATARMYKSQFIKWGWSKYNSKRLQREVSSGRPIHKPAGKSCRRAARSARPTSTAVVKAAKMKQQAAEQQKKAIVVPPRMPHGNDVHFCIERVLGEIRNHILCFHEAKTEWKTTPGVDLIRVYNYKAYDSFRSAFDHFIRNEHEQGGQVLRHAFLQVEEILQTDFSGSFYCLFIELPDLLQHYNRVDVLLILLNHINRLAPFKTGNTALAHIFLILQSIVHLDAKQLAHYVEQASLLWARMLVQLRGEKDRSSLMAKRNYLRHSKTLDHRKVNRIVEEYLQMLQQAERFYGPNGEWPSTLKHLEDITLGVEHNHAIYQPDFLQRSERLAGRLESKYNEVNAPKHEWDVQDRNIYSNTFERLSVYYYRKGNVVKAAQAAQKAQDGWANGTWHDKVERLLIKEGRTDEAEKISWTRLESVYWDEVQMRLQTTSR